MKYVLLFCGTSDDQSQFENLGPEQRAAMYQEVGKWFEANHDHLRGAEQLASPTTATTVRPGTNGHPLVTDGPFMEGKEVIGGFAVIDVADLDEALRLAKAWPAGPVEIRPVIEM